MNEKDLASVFFILEIIQLGDYRDSSYSMRCKYMEVLQECITSLLQSSVISLGSNIVIFSSTHLAPLFPRCRKGSWKEPCP